MFILTIGAFFSGCYKTEDANQKKRKSNQKEKKPSKWDTRIKDELFKLDTFQQRVDFLLKEWSLEALKVSKTFPSSQLDQQKTIAKINALQDLNELKAFKDKIQKEAFKEHRQLQEIVLLTKKIFEKFRYVLDMTEETRKEAVKTLELIENKDTKHYSYKTKVVMTIIYLYPASFEALKKLLEILVSVQISSLSVQKPLVFALNKLKIENPIIHRYSTGRVVDRSYQHFEDLLKKAKDRFLVNSERLDASSTQIIQEFFSFFNTSMRHFDYSLQYEVENYVEEKKAKSKKKKA